MQRKFSIIALLMAMAITFSSCGVMFGGSKYEARIIAKDRPNADIYVNGQKAGRGTVTGLYKRNEPLKVELKEEGCENTSKIYNKAFRTGNFILSVVSWGLFSLIDIGTGASYKPDHENNPEIKRVSTKQFDFNVESTPCAK